MLAMLSSGLGGLLRKVAPAAINWGVNKLMNTNVGKKYVAPAARLLMQPMMKLPSESEPPMNEDDN